MKAPTPTEKSKKQLDYTKNATKNFDYITIVDRLRTGSWGNDSHPTGVVKPVNGIPTFPLSVKAIKLIGMYNWSKIHVNDIARFGHWCPSFYIRRTN